MRPRINVVTLAVEDLERALEFYRDGLGLETRGIVGRQFTGSAELPAGDVAMFTLEGGLVLAVYPRSELAKDARVGPGSVAGSGLSLGHIVGSREEVDAVLVEAERAGATITGAAAERPWGIYSGYFRDPDGHLWEVIHSLEPGSDGG